MHLRAILQDKNHLRLQLDLLLQIKQLGLVVGGLIVRILRGKPLL